MKHTKGPWHTERRSATVAICEADQRIIGEMYGMTTRPETEWYGNACLVAAAPDLLAALERLLDKDCPFECDTEGCECGKHGNGLDDKGNPCEHIQARRAIAKAKGV